MAKLSELMNATNDARPARVAQSSSQVQMANLLKQLSEPRLVAEFTPHGTATRQVRTEHDERILDRVAAMRDRLAECRSLSKQSFTRAHGL